jgi:pyruvate,water dikinase
MWFMGKKSADRSASVDSTVARVREKYLNFRELLTLNNECLELMARLQEDLQFAPPRRDVVEGRIAAVFTRVAGVVSALNRLSGMPHPTLAAALREQREEIERYAATQQELSHPRLSMWLSEIGEGDEETVGSKAAMLGEIRNNLGLPVPDGFALTTEAYRQCAGIPFWRQIRDAVRDLDLNDLAAAKRVSESLASLVLTCPLPRTVEVAIAGRTETLLRKGGALAVRSSAVGEGGAKSFAGQFLSLLNVPPPDALDAYRRIIASRFSERALFYRLSTGLREVDTPMAALFLLVVPARASGIMYTRNPSDTKSKTVWITATRGLALDIASGRMPADLFVVSRSRPHSVLERSIVRKDEAIVVEAAGGIVRRSLPEGAQTEPSLQEPDLRTLAEWGVLVERRFDAPQDIEWVLDLEGRLWIVQSRPLVHSEPAKSKPRPRPKVEPLVAGGRTIYPGRTSGPAFLVDDFPEIAGAPPGAVVFIRKPAPEIVEIFPRIAGLVAEWGNVTGHAATLLREFRIPSVFQMSGAFERVANGEPVSLDAVQSCVYPGTLWPPSRMVTADAELYAARGGDPIWRRLLSLNLLDPAAADFRPSGCRSAHDVLRYCHEKAIEAMFQVNDTELEPSADYARRLVTDLPLNVQVLDLGGGVAPREPSSSRVGPAEVVSRPFQALWKGISHPGVSWTREMPASFGDLASILARSFTPQTGMRPLGEKSYLLVAGEYMNFNARLAYHFSLVDSCLSETAGDNYISFRFEGGGATRQRRGLRACFLERCLSKYGFHTDRRGDLVNAWFRKAPPDRIAERLDILGRLMACSSQLDMYMTSHEIMEWYVEQFLSGNYALKPPELNDGL